MDDSVSNKKGTVEVSGFKADRRVLTIDQGNSSAKAVIWDGNVEEASIRMFDPSIEDILPLFENGVVDACVYCSVGHNDAKFLESLRRLVDGELLVLTPSTPLPIGVHYMSRATLGNDRVAAAAGAHALYPGEGALVVDAGTAVTIDVLSEEGVFMGGNIAPGMRLRFGSLHEFTERLPLVDPSDSVEEFGTDTVSAIRSGVQMGMVSEIMCSFEAAKKFGCNRIILTGNDAPVLMPLLRRFTSCVEEVPSLVGRGLLSILDHNEQGV